MSRAARQVWTTAWTALLVAAALSAPARSRASESESEDPPAMIEAAPATRALALQAAVGLGVGTLAFVRPTRYGVQKLPDAPFAAAEFVLRAHVRPEAALSLDVLLVYQTSIGLELQVEPLFALPERVDVRAQRVELSAAPVLRLGQGSGALRLAFPAGLVFRSFFPEVHQPMLSDYHVGGPLLRAELWVPLGELLALRAGPEAQWLVIIDSSLRDRGACCQGAALGGQGSIEARVGSILRVAFAYRQSHSFLPAAGWRFNDVERFLTVRIAGEL